MQQEATIPEKDLRQVLTGSEEKVPYTIQIEIFSLILHQSKSNRADACQVNFRPVIHGWDLTELSNCSGKKWSCKWPQREIKFYTKKVKSTRLQYHKHSTTGKLQISRSFLHGVWGQPDKNITHDARVQYNRRLIPSEILVINGNKR